MAAKKAQPDKAAANGKKNGAAASGKKTTGKSSKRTRAPRNAGEATMLAWAETYKNREKRFKIWENR